MYEVEVEHEWRGYTSFEFATEEEAEEFRETVNDGGEEGLDAIIYNGDITPETGTLVSWTAL